MEFQTISDILEGDTADKENIFPPRFRCDPRDGLEISTVNSAYDRLLSKFEHTWHETNPHPLKTPIIIQTVLNKLPVHDLKNCRLVSKEWLRQSLIPFAKKSRLILGSYARVLEYVHESSTWRQHFENYKIGGEEIIDLNQEVWSLFFSKYGEWILSLNVDKAIWTSAGLRKLLFQTMPHLEEFEIDISHMACLNRHRFLPKYQAEMMNTLDQIWPKVKTLRFSLDHACTESRFIKDLIAAAPNVNQILNLKSVQIENTLHVETLDRNLANVNPLVSHLLLNWPSCRLRSLRTLCMNFYPGTATCWRKKKLPLTNLDINILFKPKTTLEPTEVHLLLKSFGDTLTTLRINWNPFRTQEFFHYAMKNEDLPNLRNLSFARVRNSSMKFLEDFDQLETLFVTQEDFIDSYCSLRSDLSEFHPLKILKLYYFNDRPLQLVPFSEAMLFETVGKITDNFPYLTSLRVEEMTDKCLQVIYSNLSQLVELEATSGNFTDTGVTGIVEIDLNVKDGFKIALDGDKIVFPVVKLPNLKCLKKLKRLRLESLRITDWSIYFIIWGLKNQLSGLHILKDQLEAGTLWSMVNYMNCLQLLRLEICAENKGITERYPTAKDVDIAREILRLKGGVLEAYGFLPDEHHDPVMIDHTGILEKNRFPLRISVPQFPG